MSLISLSKREGELVSSVSTFIACMTLISLSKREGELVSSVSTLLCVWQSSYQVRDRESVLVL